MPATVPSGVERNRVSSFLMGFQVWIPCPDDAEGAMEVEEPVNLWGFLLS